MGTLTTRIFRNAKELQEANESRIARHRHYEAVRGLGSIGPAR
jgi:hypothetical protein